MIVKVKHSVVAVLVLALMGGCELPETITTDTTTSTGTGSVSTSGGGSTGDESANGLNMASVAVMGAYDFRSANVTANATGVSISGAAVSLSWDPHPVWGGTDGSCDAVVVAVWQSGGGWTGGYFDYAPQNASGYTWSLHHIVDGYGGPGSGALVGFFICARDGSERSNVVFTRWP